ncbi:MAG: hypothetical protein M1813_005630 [Trichoglossum hirsutum]|nr:MAG: hypothetical protein M1813_005630 [Trichoglossum hirsutum]
MCADGSFKRRSHKAAPTKLPAKVCEPRRPIFTQRALKQVYVVRRSPLIAVREWRTPFAQRRGFLHAGHEQRTPESTAYATERPEIEEEEVEDGFEYAELAAQYTQLVETDEDIRRLLLQEVELEEAVTPTPTSGTHPLEPLPIDLEPLPIDLDLLQLD